MIEHAPTARRRLMALALAAALLVPLLVTILVSVRAERAREPALASLRPAAALAAAAGATLAAHSRSSVLVIGGTVAGILVVVGLAGLLRRKKEALAPALALFSCALGAIGEVQLLLGRLWPGIALYVAALLLFGVSLLLSRSEALSPPETAVGFPVGMAALVVIAWTGLFYRFYALNQLPPYFDGEAAWFMACATSLHGASQVNFAADGPWSPFGWLYYLPVFFFTRTCGTTLLSIRFVSAVIGFLAIPLFFGLLRRLAGTLEAVLGAIFLCFGLTELYWSRTDIFPYHAPGFLAISLAWASYEAITSGRLRYFVAAAGLMMLSYHQYPSGQTSFLIPVGAVLGQSLFSRGFVRRSWKGILVILLGVALWAAGLGINGWIAGAPFKWRNPFALNPGKTLWSLRLEHPGLGTRARFLAQSTAKGVGAIVRTQFVDVAPSAFPHHQDVPAFGDLSRRHTSAPVAMLLALGALLLLVRPGRPSSIVLLSWLVAGSLPGLLSDFPASRRIATLFPAFMAVAALAGGVVLRSAAKLLGTMMGRAFAVVALGSLFAGLGAVVGRLYLGQRPEKVLAVSAADAIRPDLEQGTLAVFEADYGEYTATQLTYLLLDQLNEGPRPAIWRIAQFADWPTIAFRPTPNPASWVYKYTMLRGRAAALAKPPGFDRILFLVQDTVARKVNRDLLTQIYPESEIRHLHVVDGNDRFNFAALAVDASTLEDGLRPVVTLPPEKAAATPTGWWEGIEVRIQRDGEPSAPVTVSAGLWISELRRSSLRILGGGDGAVLLVDGTPQAENEVRPLIRGIHRLDVRLGPEPQLPLRMEAAFEGGDFQPVRPTDLTSPRLATLPLLAAESVLPYPGFGAPIPVVDVSPDFLSGLAVSPDGSIVIARGLREELKLELYPAQGGPPTVWSQPWPPGERPNFFVSVSFIGEKGVALLSWPHLYVYDRQGHLQKEIPVGHLADGAGRMGANEDGEFFIPATSRGGVIVLDPEGREIALLSEPHWFPDQVSVPYRGPVLVHHDGDRLTLFERGPSGWAKAWVQPGRYVIDAAYFAVRADGWIVSRDQLTAEYVVFDPQLRRRIVAEPLRDPSRLPVGRFVGFDRGGRFYLEANGHIWKLTPVEE